MLVISSIPKTKRKLPKPQEIVLVKKMLEQFNKKFPCKEKNQRKCFASFSDIGIYGYWDFTCTDEKVWRNKEYNKTVDIYKNLFKKKFNRNIYFSLSDGSFIDKQYKKQSNLAYTIKVGVKYEPYYDRIQL